MEDLDPTTDTLVNRIPRPQIKRRGSRGSGSKSSGDGSERRERKRPKPTDLEEKFNKLDPSDPDQCKRIQQRKKDIAKGKNTAGYHAYTQQVPKEKRRIRSMDTPSTPNPTLDISKKRWQGLVRAWRIALHKYDPADIITSFQESSKSGTVVETSGLADASKESLPLISPSSNRVPSTPISKKSNKRPENEDQGTHDVFSPQVVDEQSPISLLAESPMEKLSLSPFDDEESDDDIL